jgi:catalase
MLALASEAAALDFVSDAFNHLKAIGHVPAAEPVLRRAGIIEVLMDAASCA